MLTAVEEETLTRASASHVVVNSSTFTVLPLPHDAYFRTVKHTGVAWAHRKPLAARFLAYVSGALGRDGDRCIKSVSAQSKRDGDRCRESPPQSQILRNLNGFS